jgi:hyaluronan synthase
MITEYSRPEKSLSSSQLAFWMLFVGVAFVMIYVRAMSSFDAHPAFLVYVWAVAVTIIFRYVFYAIYDPILSKSGEYQPSVMIIVPAKNESSVVYKTAKAINELEYPREKLRVVLVNDGSDDDTGYWIDKCATDFNHHVIHLEDNLGKRKAIARAMDINSSEITVLVDSDSALAKSSLVEGLRGFISPKVAAICGHTDVDNATSTWLTRMQTQQYFIAFKTFKSLEGFFGSVICCSGAFSMYRTDIIKPLMREWTTQKFLGRVRTFGDDRGLTNLLLRDGHDSIYLPEAKARTIVPKTLGSYVRQQLRWRRSFLMESLSALGHMWKRPIGASLMFYIVLCLTMMSPFVVSYFLIIGPIFHDFNPLVYILGLTLIILLHQVFYWAFQLPPADKVGFFSLMPMLPIWIFFTLLLLPWAMMTIRDGSWGTR